METTPPKTPLPKVHPLAIAAFAIPFVVLFLMFTPQHPKNETLIFGILVAVSFVCVILSTVAIRDIRHQPARYRGIGMAAFGLLAIPLMMYGIFFHLNLEQCDMFGCQKAVQKHNVLLQKKIEERFREAYQEAFKASSSDKTGEPSGSFSKELNKRLEENLAKTPTLAMDQLTPRERWLVENRETLEVVQGAIFVGLLAIPAWIALFIVYRCWKPKPTDNQQPG